MDNDAKEELKKLSSKYRKFLLNTKNRDIVSLNPEYTIKAVNQHLNFPIENFINDEEYKSFDKFSESVRTLSQNSKRT